MELMVLIIACLVLSGILFAIIWIFMPLLISQIITRRQIIKHLLEHSDGFFNLFFIGLFSTEQAVLIVISYYLIKDQPIAQLIIGIFALFGAQPQEVGLRTGPKLGPFGGWVGLGLRLNGLWQSLPRLQGKT